MTIKSLSVFLHEFEKVPEKGKKVCNRALTYQLGSPDNQYCPNFAGQKECAAYHLKEQPLVSSKFMHSSHPLSMVQNVANEWKIKFSPVVSD